MEGRREGCIEVESREAKKVGVWGYVGGQGEGETFSGRERHKETEKKREIGRGLRERDKGHREEERGRKRKERA